MFATYGILDGSWLTALVALLMGGIYFFIRNVEPRKITVRITGIGIQVEDVITPWSDVKDFWILLGSNYTELHLSPQRTLQREIIIFIRDPQTTTEEAPDPGLVRQTLLQLLPEHTGMEERMLDSFARILKL